MPMRPLPRTILEVSTPNRRSSPMAASAMGFLAGSTVTYAAGRPKVASATATLASPPPKVATNWGLCRNRSKPGGASRNMISPKVTVVFGMGIGPKIRFSTSKGRPKSFCLPHRVT